MQPYSNNQEPYGNQQRPYQGYDNQSGFPQFNPNNPASSYPNNAPPQEYSNQQFPPSYPSNPSNYDTNSTAFNQFQNQPPNYPGYSNNVSPNQSSSDTVLNQQVKTEPNIPPNYRSNEIKPDPNIPQNTAATPYCNPNYTYPSGGPTFPEHSENNANTNYPCPFPNYPQNLETKPPLGSASSNSPVTSWPMTDIKTEVDKFKAEELKTEVKSESDGEVKIEDLDTKTIVKDETKKCQPSANFVVKDLKPEPIMTNKIESKAVMAKSDKSESEEEIPKKGKPRGKAKESKKKEKPKAKSRSKPKGRKDRKASKEKPNDDSDSEDSEKEEKMNREEELALVKKAEEMTYDWATELLKDYVPGIIENSTKMQLFFYILNESIKMGDRLLLFSQSLFTLNLIEDFLEKNYIPGTNSLWERNTNYYRK